VPHRLIRGGNTQTIVAALLSAPGEPDGTVLDFAPTTLGDRIALHTNQPSTPPDRFVLMLHGLAGCHGSSYVVRTCHRLLQAGFGVCRMDARGAGAGNRQARYHNHAGRSEDMQAAVDFITSRYPQSHLTVVGFSLGASILLNWLGRCDSRIPRQVDSAMAVAPPIELKHCAANLKFGLSRFYDRHFAKTVMRRLRARRLVRPDMVDFPIPRMPERLSQFDVRFTAPAGGFASLDEYYETASSAQHLSTISTPTLIMVDEHDPVIPVDMFDRHPLSPTTQIKRTNGGGHLGYVSRSGIDPDRHWMTWRVVDAVKAFDEQSRPIQKFGSDEGAEPRLHEMA